MPNDTSAHKSWEDLWAWGQTDLHGLVNYTFGLQTKLVQLQDSAAQNSANSSRPPSTDREKPAPKSLREKSGRKPGGQSGHPGSTLAFSDHPEEIKVHPLQECSQCGEDLSGVPVEDYEARQVYDLPELKLKCTEHRAPIKNCPCCHGKCTAPFPEGVTAPVQYGANFRAWLVYLYDVQQGASRRVSEMCQEMFGFPVSEATLQAARQEQYEALEPFENRLVEILPQEPVLCADETQVPINKVKHWVHILSTPLLTFFSVQVLRGKEAIKAIGIIPKFTGWLMHDFLSSYLGFENCLHTFCKSHLLRELVFIFEQHHQTWAKDLQDLFLEMLQRVKQLRARDGPMTEAEYKRWLERYGQILRAGRKANPLTPEQQAKKRRKQSKEQNLLDRLEGYDLGILAFLCIRELPFTNNEAERPFRMIKVRVKISGCFRTLQGARRHMRIRSYISTLRKRSLPALEYLRRALDGDPFLPEGAKTT